MTTDKGARRRILDAALEIVRKDGLRALTQTRVASAAGLRQSHLTYYFPRKADLLAATLEASHGRVSHPRAAAGDPLNELQTLILDRNQMKFFLGAVLEASERADLRASFAAHARGAREALASAFGREPDDPDVIAFVDALRGMGLRLLLEPDRKRAMPRDLAALAARFGLVRSA